MQFRVTFRAEQEITNEPIEHVELMEAPTEAELRRAIPQLLLTLGQTGFIHFEPKLIEWQLTPASRLRNIRVTYSTVVLTDTFSGAVA